MKSTSVLSGFPIPLCWDIKCLLFHRACLVTEAGFPDRLHPHCPPTNQVHVQICMGRYTWTCVVHIHHGLRDLIIHGLNDIISRILTNIYRALTVHLFTMYLVYITFMTNKT